MKKIMWKCLKEQRNMFNVLLYIEGKEYESVGEGENARFMAENGIPYFSKGFLKSFEKVTK